MGEWRIHPCRTGGRPADGGNLGPGKQPAPQQEANAGRASTRWVTIRMSQRARLPNRRRTGVTTGPGSGSTGS